MTEFSTVGLFVSHIFALYAGQVLLLCGVGMVTCCSSCRSSFLNSISGRNIVGEKMPNP